MLAKEGIQGQRRGTRPWTLAYQLETFSRRG